MNTCASNARREYPSESFVVSSESLICPVIRPAVPADAPAIARIHVEAWKVTYQGIMPAAILDALDATEREDQWRRLLDARADSVLVAELKHELAGFCSLAGVVPDPDEELEVETEIETLYLDPRRRRMGIGRLLVDAAIDSAIAKGHARVGLWCAELNTDATSFYRKIGFKPTGRRKTVVIGGSPVEHVRFRRLIARPRHR